MTHTHAVRFAAFLFAVLLSHASAGSAPAPPDSTGGAPIHLAQFQQRGNRQAIIDSYRVAFGREPLAGEIQFWEGQGPLSVADLVTRHRTYLRDNAGARRESIMRSYQMVFGRAPNADEARYWDDRVRQSGETYADMVNVHRQHNAQNPPAPQPSGSYAKGQCANALVTRAIRELIGRDPDGSGESGECAPNRYAGNLQDYNDVKRAVRVGLFNPRAEKGWCFGGMGSACDALQFGLSEGIKAGRTVNADGSFNMWISVGSINHDNCCLAHPNGKMCSGPGPDTKNPFGRGNGQCIAEWDKAHWNGVDGRAWTANFRYESVPDLTIVDNPRSTKTQGGIPLGRFETAETRRHAAPPGQALDPGDEKYCASGRGTLVTMPLTPKQWIICQ